MRKAFISFRGLVALVALAARDHRRRRPPHRCSDPRLRDGRPHARQARSADDRHRQPGLPAVVGRAGEEGTGFKTSNPVFGQGLRVGRRLRASRRSSGSRTAQVKWTLVPYTKSYAPGQEAVRLLPCQVSYKPVRAKAVTFSASYYDVNQAVVGLKGKPIAKVKTIAGLKPYKFGVPIGTTSYDYVVNYIKPSSQAAGLRHPERRRHRAQERPDRRSRRRLPEHRLHHRRPGAEQHRRRPAARPGQAGALRARLRRRATRSSAASTRRSPAMRKDGTIKRLEQQWLAKAGGAPLLK